MYFYDNNNNNTKALTSCQDITTTQWGLLVT